MGHKELLLREALHGRRRESVVLSVKAAQAAELSLWGELLHQFQIQDLVALQKFEFSGMGGQRLEKTHHLVRRSTIIGHERIVGRDSAVALEHRARLPPGQKSLVGR